MSKERILIIKQQPEAQLAACKIELEQSDEQFQVFIADSVPEGNRMLREKRSEAQLNAVIINTEEVDHTTLDLLSNIRSSNSNIPIMVMTTTASSAIRQSLTALSSECIIKTGEYEKHLWRVVKLALQRYSNIRVNRPTKTQVKRTFPSFAIKKT